MEKSLSDYSRALLINGAQLAKVQETQIELAQELQSTQKALNATIPILNAHSNAINSLKTLVFNTHFSTQQLHEFSVMILRLNSSHRKI